ncbi:MAG: HlyD family efflux transporter periplasmic adaptor subunit [Epsilonproteobacteria bacterium]|nr:HlyD family efflux transporter periplasmic adaptor subunit [Campylobacterota bacterium]
MKKVGTIIILLLIVVFGYSGFVYLDYRHNNAVSDAAFVKSDSITILSFKVAGKVIMMSKNEGQSVKKGEILAKIDDVDFINAKNQISNTIKATIKSKESLEIKLQRISNELNLNEKIAKNNISSYKQKMQAVYLSINANKTKLKKLSIDEVRYKKMLEKKLISKNIYEKISTSKNALNDMILSQEKTYDATKSNLKNVKNFLKLSIVKKMQTKEIQKSIESLALKIKSMQDRLQEIKNKISYCKIYAPFDGKIAKKFINQDRIISIGYPVYSLVNPKDLHIEVLLSEKKLNGVKVGNDVTIKIDALENKKFRGKVQSILPTSASTFSLVPRDIASGEFTKLDQRFTIRVSLDDTKGLLTGMSANIAIKRTK